MARPIGSKVIECKRCGGQIIALVSTVGTCKTCGSQVKFTKKLMKELGKKLD